MIVESCYLEQSLIDHSLLELLVDAKLLNSTRYAKVYKNLLCMSFYAIWDESISNLQSTFSDVVYIRSDVVDFNFEELSTFLEIPSYYEVVGTSLKNEIDLDMVIAELNGGSKRTSLREGKLLSASLTLKYFGLYKISFTNWMPSSNASVVLRDRVIMLYLLGTGKPINMGQVIYDNIVQLSFTKKEPFKKLLFP